MKREKSNRQHTNKVYQVLSLLDPSEQMRFLRFLQSPYFNKSSTLQALYSLLVDALERDTAYFDRDRVWADLSGGRPYDDVTFRKHCSDLLSLLEQFMAVETRQGDAIGRQLDAFAFVVRRQLEPLYLSAVRKTRQVLDAPSYPSLMGYWHRYRFERLFYQMMDYDFKLDLKANLEQISDSLDVFYWTEKLWMYNAALSQHQTGAFQYDLRFAEEVVDYLSDYPVEEAPELAIAYNAFRMLQQEEDTSGYLQYRRLLEQYAAQMPREEAAGLYDAALRYCTRKINRGDESFLNEYLQLFEEGLKKGVFIKNGALAPWRMNNAVGAALRLGRLDWAEDLIRQYAPLLPADSRDNTRTFNLARVYRYQQQHDKVLQLLRDVEYEDTGYNLISKAMLLITYYELDEWDALDSHIDAFRTYLRRHKNISADRRRMYLNLIRFARKLTRLQPGNKAQAAGLRAEIEASRSSTVNYDWLMEKLHEAG
jgi:hypothetical protein